MKLGLCFQFMVAAAVGQAFVDSSIIRPFLLVAWLLAQFVPDACQWRSVARAKGSLV